MALWLALTLAALQDGDSARVLVVSIDGLPGAAIDRLNDDSANP